MSPTAQPKSSSASDTAEGSPVRQLTVFLQNRVGALMALVKLLGDHHIAVLGLSLQDSTELAIVRLIVSAPDDAQMVFIEKGIPHTILPVTVIELKETETSLPQALSALLGAEVNISFSYPLLIRPGQNPVLVLHLDSADFAAEVLAKAGFKVLKQEDLSR
ncbi:MAG: hypothetical protein HS117_10890 [Verrucomicrobiaceae bacterium]|nr:hypothetical protein [Verrucomicrobiaceae bacterium]